MSTETADPRYMDVDGWPTAIAVDAMIEGQIAALATLSGQTAALATASDAAAARLSGGGRIAYAGAGTSGRIAVQDGVELTPTYDWPAERLVFLLAGGEAAVMHSVEGAEDSAAAARAAVTAQAIGARDVLIGVAASGRTPFTLAAVEAARAAGALTIAVANNAGTPLLAAADHAILADTGSELIAGSTRMKAGTAQKAALNIISTAIMLRSGLVYRGLMVNMRVSNEKLVRRAQAMVATLADVAPAVAADALEASGRDIKTAVLIATGVTPDDARARLVASHGDLRGALATDG